MESHKSEHRSFVHKTSDTDGLGLHRGLAFFGGLSFDSIVDGTAKTIELLPANMEATAFQEDCTGFTPRSSLPVISTDPPYYDNVGYADLSDFFYVWLRQSLQSVFPDL